MEKGFAILGALLGVPMWAFLQWNLPTDGRGADIVASFALVVGTMSLIGWVAGYAFKKLKAG